MAKTEDPSRLQTQYPKPKTSLFLCCFGSLPNKSPMSSTITASDPVPKHKRTSWFSWRRIPMKQNSPTKTVPFEASVSEDQQKLHSKPSKAHSSKLKSKSNLHKATNLPPPSQTPPVLSATPNQTPSQTRHGGKNKVDDTRQQGRASPKHSKRQLRRLSSLMQSQTTSRSSSYEYDPVVGMSVVMVTLVIMMLWGRLCAILCTSAWLYFIPRFRKSTEKNDENNSNNRSNDMDLDSEEYKKKVIMEGLLERNHRSTQ